MRIGWRGRWRAAGRRCRKLKVHESRGEISGALRVCAHFWVAAAGAGRAAGALIWILVYTGLGYVFSDQIEIVGAYAVRTGSGLVMVILAVVSGWVGWKYIQRQRFLKKIEVARITPEELRSKLEAGEEVFVIDLRSEREPEEDAITGAR